MVKMLVIPDYLIKKNGLNKKRFFCHLTLLIKYLIKIYLNYFVLYYF